jgi:predicted Zn-dependent peptidase
VVRDGAQTHIVLGTRALSYADPRRYPMVLLSMLLGGGMSSRLFQRVREELGLAYSVYSFQQFFADTGVHGIYVATAPESARDALATIRAELAAVAEHGLPEEEVDMGKSQLKGHLTLSLESVSSRMYRAAAVELYGEPYRTLDEVLAEVGRIEPADVAALAHDLLAPEKQTVVSLGPTAALD